MGIGSGENGQFTFLDSIAIVSFIIGLLNYEENLTQSDKQELEDELNRKIDGLLKEIHSHLELQDKKIEEILEVLKNDSR